MNVAAYMVVERESIEMPAMLLIDTTDKWSSSYIRSIMSFKRHAHERYKVDYVVTQYDTIDREKLNLALDCAEQVHGPAESWPTFTHPRDLYAHLGIS